MKKNSSFQSRKDKPHVLNNKHKINALISLGFNRNREKCHCGFYSKPRMNYITNKFSYSCYRWQEEDNTVPNHCNFNVDVKPIINHV